MIEFALLLPIFILMMVLTFDFGRMVLTNVTLHNAAYTAARAGAQIGGASVGGQQISRDAFVDTVDRDPVLRMEFLAANSPRIVTGQSCTALGANRYVTVEAQYRFTFLTPGLNALLDITGTPFNLRTSAVARCEVVR